MTKWDRKSLINFTKFILTSTVIAAIVSSFLVPVFLVPIYNNYFSEEKQIREIIEKEADFVLKGKINEAVSLFDEKAIVRDMAGGHVDQEKIWNGISNITERYRTLPQFVYLQHTTIDIIISTDKTYARATSNTIARIKVNGTEIEQSINLGEKWTFKKIDNGWKITSFVCNIP